MSYLQQCLDQLVSRLPHLRSDEAMWQAQTIKDGTQLMCVWQRLLCDPRTTLAAASSLRGQLLSMVSLLVDTAERQNLVDLSTTPMALATAALRLLEFNPNIASLLQRLFRHIDSPLIMLLSQPAASTAAAAHQHQQLALHPCAEQIELLALATLRALQLSPKLGSSWKRSLWFRLLHHPLPLVRWTAVQGVGMMLQLSPAVKEQLTNRLLTDEQLVSMHMRWTEERTAVALELAQRWQPCSASADCCGSSSNSSLTSTSQQLPPAKGFVRVCDLEIPARPDNNTVGLSCSSSSSGATGQLMWSKLVLTPSMQTALESAALALCQGAPVVVEGPAGSGKTSLIRALAAATGNDASALWLHLDDQQDAKSLLGSYTCTAVPGEFVWQMGPLARAVAEGRWVVIEGVDTAPPDVLAALLPLLESGVLHIPSRGTVMTAAPGFQVLGTITSTGSSSSSGAAGAVASSSTAQDVLGGLWSKVRLSAPSEAEQLMILEGLYPDLTPLLPLAQATVKLVQMAAGHTAAVGDSASTWQHQAAAAALRAAGIRPGELALSLGRQFSTRDLMKWCGRLTAVHGHLLMRCLRQHNTAAATTSAKTSKKKKSKSGTTVDAVNGSNGSSSDVAIAQPMLDLSRVDQELKVAAFTEAADLFAGLVSSHDVKLRLLTAVAGLWGVAGPAAAAEQYEDLAKPNLHMGQQELTVGRAAIPLLQSSSSLSSSSTAGLGTFSPTGLALRVMERVGTALSRSESVLLVGETGTGKTTTLSQLAKLVGAHLVAFNLSQQTDSSDLLGGYKPVGQGEALLPLLEPFGELLRKTWKRGNNEEFLSRTLKYAQRKKWSHLLSAYKTALAKLKLDQPAAMEGSSNVQHQEQEQQQDGAAAAAPVGAGRGRSGSKGKAATALDTKPSKKRRVSSAAAATAAAEVQTAPEPTAAAGSKSKTSGTSNSAQNQPLSPQLRHEWRRFAADLEAAERASAAAEGGFAFAFVEGALVKALRHGWWLLLDEINLAPPEVLERIAGILEAHAPSKAATKGEGETAAADASTGLLLVERGDVSVISRHPNFRLVAAMNPATDAGKRDLPPQLRSRFTEFWVGEPRSRSDLGQMVGSYLAGAAPAPPVEQVVDFYLEAKAEAECRLTDGAGQRPAYSLRSLCRALDYARRAAPSYGLQRALWDGLSMSFLTQLSPEAAPRLEAIMMKHIIPGGSKALKSLMRAPPCPGEQTHVLFEQFWLERGPLPLPELGRDDDGSARRFVLTPSVRQQLCNLARCVLSHKHPILLQGPTSSGKTSLVAYLAAQTGHKFVRINNHQHTDLQEYLGSWVPDEQGRLVFREGALVSALRAGHWVVLDELNLAPTEVLEALNRLLDDNRELFVPELQEVVRPHPHFMLFATQNPPGAYAGRKALSRAFRGRFLELHVEELPDHELSDILHQRCGIAPSYAAKMVTVMRELQRRRQRSNVFAGRHGFITPRDLFRWAERGAVGYEALAVDGFMVLGERLRSSEERSVVVEVLEQVMKVKIDMEQVYEQVGAEPQQRLAEALSSAQQAAAEAATCDSSTAIDPAAGPVQQLQSAAASQAAAAAVTAAREEAAAIQQALTGMVWTRSMKRLYTLVNRCLCSNEPVLLVGDTGTGKTSVCQLLALMRHTHLHVLNCNQHTETSDFLGGFRPTRTRLRDVAAFRATAQELLSSPAWHLTNTQPSAALVAAADEAASPVEIEEVLQALTGQLAAVQAVLAAAVKHKEQTCDNIAPDQPDAAAMAAAEVAAAASADVLQQHLESLAAGVAALRSAAAAARAPFGWEDGPLVVAMRRGELLLVDELNLAEDAVLERLNSVLEPGRSLTLAEKGGGGAEVVVGAEGFMVLATMNPGGDFGKKELSPALSNRFTQIWVPAITDESELQAILESRLATAVMKSVISRHLLDFWKLFVSEAPAAARGGLSVRDLLAWVGFINATADSLGALPAYVHGAYLTLLDGLGLGLGIPAALLAPLKAKCRQLLQQQLTAGDNADQQQGAAAAVIAEAAGELTLQADKAVDEVTVDGRWGIRPFYIQMDPSAAAGSSSSGGPKFNWQAPTTCRNAFRLLRAMQLGKAVLLEGSPGVGKTSLVSALCQAAGVKMVRINCSEHTDMIDLLGADLPAPGGAAGQFAWCDGPLLSAVKSGDWVLLDELNLAGQSVLEGLNGLLDHRQALFVPELGQSFKAHPRFRLFAAQNPLQEGGGRKGLPKSFLNRFTRVAIELLQPDDLRAIAAALHPQLPRELIQKMVLLLMAMQEASSSSIAAAPADSRSAPFAVAGGPWEFNLRDLLRWCELVGMVAQQQQQQSGALTVQENAAAAADHMDVDISTEQQRNAVAVAGVASAADLDAAAEHFVGLLFTQRLRTESDRQRVQQLFRKVWGRDITAASTTAVTHSSSSSSTALIGTSKPSIMFSARELQVGLARMKRASDAAAAGSSGPQQQQQVSDLLLPSWQSPLLESVLSSLSCGWMVLLVGPSGSGKTSLARLAAAAVGVELQELAMTQGTDTSDLLGGFEQVEPARKLQDLSAAAQQLSNSLTQRLLLLGAANNQQQQHSSQTFIEWSSGIHETWDNSMQLSRADGVPAAAGVSASSDDAAVTGDTQTITGTIRQLKQLRVVLQRMQQAIMQLQQMNDQIPDLDTANNDLDDLHQRSLKLSASVSDLISDLDQPTGSSTAGRFEWVDGSLTRAIQQGNWVLLDNANLVNPTVLDRLNGLLEPNGVLQLDEAGATAAADGSSSGGRVVVPHPGFRLLLAYDPKHGEVSRAMRNRGVELCIMTPHQSNITPAGAGAGASGGAACATDLQLVSAATAVDDLYDLNHDDHLHPSWSLSGQPDIESVLASCGVSNSMLLAAMAAAHTTMAAACAEAHRKAPGLREIRAWAVTAGVLLHQGRCLGPALWQSWVQVYMRGYAATWGLVAEAQAAFIALCQQIQLQPPADAAVSDDAVVALQQQQGAGELSNNAAADDDVDMLDNEQLQNALVPAAAARGLTWPNQLLRPCQWPVWCGYSDLADDPAVAAAARDVALPVWLLDQAVAAHLTAAADCSSSDSLSQLPAVQQSLFPHLLTRHGLQQQASSTPAAAATLVSRQFHPPSVSSSVKSCLARLAELVMAAAAACMCRVSSASSNSLKPLLLQQHLAQIAAGVDSTMGAAPVRNNSGCRGLLSLLQQLVPVLAGQPWSAQLQQLLQQQAWSVQLQTNEQQCLPLLLPVLQQAACHAAVVAAAAAAAPAANVAGTATAYQESVWRFSNPSERARTEASHPVIDSLQHAVAAVAELEAAALYLCLQQPQQSDSSSKAVQLISLLRRLQICRTEMWDAIHGPLDLHYDCNSNQSAQPVECIAAAAAVAGVSSLQAERLAWVWSQIRKVVTKLLMSHPDLMSDQYKAKWGFLAQQMAAALQLDDQTPKPLLWWLGGHPQLPPSRSLLLVQQKAAAIAAALAAAGGSGLRVDGRGQPAGLAAAGLDWQQLLLQAVQAVQQQQEGLTAADDDVSSDMLGPISDALAAVTAGYEGVGTAQLRERLAAAAAAVLCFDTGFRRSVTQGLALLGFVPYVQLLQQQGDGAAADLDGLLTVPESLLQQATALVLPVLVQLIQAPQPQQQEASGAAAIVAALKPGSVQQQLLPAQGMLSVSARQLQLDLQQLTHTCAMQEEAGVAQSLLHWLINNTAAAAGPEDLEAASQQQQLLPSIAARLQYHLSVSGPSSCQPSAAALVPYQQLSWVLSSMLEGHQQQQQQQLPRQQLICQVLPGLLHDACYSWQEALWANAGSMASSSSSSSSSALHISNACAAGKVLSSPLLLHVASRTAAALQICAAGAADGSSKVARLQQLSLAVQQLQQQHGARHTGGSGSSDVSCTRSMLGLLLGQLLLAHVSSFATDDQNTLQQLVQRLIIWSSSSSSSDGSTAVSSVAVVQPWLDQLNATLSRSSHRTLLAVQPLLLQCAEALLLRSCKLQQQKAGKNRSSSWYDALSCEGWCWLLLGCARLQLLLPPAGVDPAGRYSYKAKAINRWITDQLDPTIQVYVMMQQLPGGPDESAVLQGLHNHRQGLCNDVSRLRTRCVPRPEPPCYLHLQQEVAAFSKGLADPQRLLTLGRALLAGGSGTAAAAAASREADMWDSSAAGWCDRVRHQFADYVDIVQPVVLAVLEVRHGLALMVGGTQAAQQAAAARHALHSSSSSADGSDMQLASVTAGLLCFPPPLATVSPASSISSSGRLIPAAGSILADPQWQKVTAALIQQQRDQANSAAASSAELTEFTWKLRAAHAALVVAVQELLASGSAAAAGSSAADSLAAVDRAFDQLLSAWLSVREYEAQEAEEAAQLFKHKTKTTTFLTEEEEDEATYKQQYPDYYASFADLADTDDLSAPAEARQKNDGSMMDTDQAAAAGDGDESSSAAAATAAQARSAAAKSLLEGQLLHDVVALHQQLFSVMAMQQLQHQYSSKASPSLTVSGQQQQQGIITDAAREQAFNLCFSLGQHLLAAQQGLLPAALDQLVAPGCIMALALQHKALNTAAAATAATAAAGAVQLDMQQPFVEEASLIQQPLAATSQRLMELLEQWPEHPLLLQLLAIVDRLLSLPLTVPLKQVLTGVELLLARAQVWEETAAKHVSLKQQLTAVAGLATRWRKLELASWKGLLERVKARHAAAASKSWYHLYQLLVLGVTGDDSAAVEDTAAGSSSSDAGYRRVASLVEAFIQTSTIGEFAARLQLLHSFACQLTAAPDSSSSSTASMLWNVLSYYSQFLPAISAAMDAGLVPLSKELSDFVRLAKWEDRGYYAMKLATEKAQRQLHRLSRRAEDCLKQPAAAVLAQASQALGLGQITAPKAALAAAAAAGKAAAKAAKAAAKDAAAAATGGGLANGTEVKGGEQQKKDGTAAAVAAAAAAAAEVDPALLGELESEDAAAGPAGQASSSLEALAAAAIGDTVAVSAATAGGVNVAKKGRKKSKVAIDIPSLSDSLQQCQQLQQAAWTGYSDAVMKSAAAGAPSTVASSSSSSYASRLPKLTAKMAKVLSPPPPTAAADSQQQQQQHMSDDVVSTLPAVQLDDLAATAASRSLALSTDTEKGARLRKKKALTDMLHALGDIGFSKRAADVPADDRQAADWFKHKQPCLAGTPLLQPIMQCLQQTAAAGSSSAVDPIQLQFSAGCWSKACSYYYKSLARLQRLQAAAVAPHRDLVGHEVTAAVAYTQHQLHIMRKQRQVIDDLATGYSQLMQVVSWVQEVTAAAAAASDTAAAAPLPDQQQARHWLSVADQLLSGLHYQLSGIQQLVAAVVPMQQQSGRQQHVIRSSNAAVTKLDDYVNTISAHRSAVDAESAKLSLAGCPVVSHAAMAAVTAAFAAIRDMQQDAATATAAMAAAARAADYFASDSSDAAVVCSMVPAWNRVLDTLAAAEQQAVQFQHHQGQGREVTVADAAAALLQCQQDWSSCLDDLVPQVLVAAQALQGPPEPQQQQQPVNDAGTAASAAGSGVMGWTANAADALKPSRLFTLVSTAKKLLSLLATASDLSQADPDSQDAAAAAASMAKQAAALLPMLQLLLGGVQRTACDVLVLHKSLGKLSYICSSVFCSLVCQGYCMPEGDQGDESAAGDGEGQLQWQEAGGTGMGEGTGKKDVSDQIQDEDQLLGAQQKDQLQQQDDEDHGDHYDDQAGGVEMDADFDGSLHDIDDRRQQQQQGDDDESEEGDDDRIDQQMGEVGDNEERVDERLWGDDDDDESADKDKQQQQQREDDVDRQQQLSVEDKSQLDYADGGADDHQQQDPKKQQQQQQQQSKQGQDDNKQQQQHDPDADEDQQQQGQGDESDDNDDQPPGADVDDEYQQQHKPTLQQQDQEFELPDDLNLDGMDEDEPGAGPDNQAGQDEQQPDGQPEQQQQQDGAAAAEDDDGAAAAENAEEQQQDQGADNGEEGEDVEAPDAAADAAQQQQPPQADDAAGDGPDADGSKRAQPQGGDDDQDQPDDQQDQPDDEDLEAVAAQGAGDDDHDHDLPQELPQAGPQGVADAAAAPQAQAQGQADKQQQQGTEDEQQQQGADTAQAMDWDHDQIDDSSAAANQASLGSAGATDQGQIAPMQQQQGGPQQQQNAGQQRKQQQRRHQQPELNPFRSLGDALERWRADLVVQHEAAQQQQQQDEEDAADADGDGDPPAADEYQYLGDQDQDLRGTTQALAPATEEQAAQQQQQQAAMQQPGQTDQQQQQQDGDAGLQQMEEDTEAAAAAGDDDDLGEDEQVAAGAPPQVWSGSHKKPGQQQDKDKQQQDKQDQQQQQQSSVDDQDANAAVDPQQKLLEEAAAGGAAAEDAGELPSLVAAKLAATTLAEEAGLEADQTQLMTHQLPADQAEALRAELDARLREAAAAAAQGIVPEDAAAAAAAAYGRDMWSRCEALVSGLAGELTEQLRLILEPSLASRLGGEYRSGKRLNMKRVIGYIASQFRRDKIWMRRSRPDKRRYQVVVAVDDSRSMAETGAGSFALEALALLCKAMSRLEVGELAVLSYGGGGGVQPLQPLEIPFTDAAGPRIMSSLRFDQDNTITDRPMLQLVEAVQHLLEVARHRVGTQGGGTTSDLRQLLLVLGDGRFHEKEALLGAVRKLVEVQGVCPVFIALDTAASSSTSAGSSSGAAAAASGSSKAGRGSSGGKGSSLLDMQSVKFVGGKPVFERYLDSFPFPYYIVLRDIAALPATLADLLRQWFELSASSS